MVLSQEQNEKKAKPIIENNEKHSCSPRISPALDNSDEESEDEFAGDHNDDDEVEELINMLSRQDFSPHMLNDRQQRMLKKVAHSKVAREHVRDIAHQKFYWEEGALNIEVKHHLFVEMEHVLGFHRNSSSVENQAGRKSSHKDNNDFLIYQLLGLLLGYVVMMRTINGNWSSEFDCTPDGDVDKVQSYCMESLALLFQSTPFLSTMFRPSSVDATIQSWVYHQPPSLGSSNSSHEIIKSLLRDVKGILSSIELSLFAIIDCWLLGRSCNTSTSCASTLNAKIAELASSPPAPESTYANDIIELFRSYHPEYGTKPQLLKKDKRNNTTIMTDKYTRKCFFLLNHFMRRSIKEREDNSVDVLWNHVLQEELDKYLQDVICMLDSKEAIY